jgi:hypothetical protein
LIAAEAGAAWTARALTLAETRSRAAPIGRHR